MNTTTLVLLTCLVAVALVLGVALVVVLAVEQHGQRRPPRPHEREWCPRPALRRGRQWWKVCELHGVQGCHTCITRDVATQDAKGNPPARGGA